MRGSEEAEVLLALSFAGFAVAPGHANGLVQLQPALTSAFQIRPLVLREPRKVRIGRMGRGVLEQFSANPIDSAATDNRDLPRLGIAPRRGSLRRHQHALYRGALDRLGKERAAAVPLLQEPLEQR